MTEIGMVKQEVRSMFLGVSYTSKGWEPAYPQFFGPLHAHSQYEKRQRNFACWSN